MLHFAILFQPTAETFGLVCVLASKRFILEFLMSLEPLKVPLVVVDQKYICREPVCLRLSEKVFSFSGDDFSIKDANSGQLWFQVKGKALSLKDKKQLFDINSQPVCNLKKEILSFFAPKQYLYAGADSQQLLCTFTKSFTFFKAKVVVEVLNKANGQMVQVHLKGNWFERNATISIGSMKEGGILIAQVSRVAFNMKEIFAGNQTYYVNMAPGCDAAFITMFCIALDELTREGK
jgi:uncharacterized protein YxjI